MTVPLQTCEHCGRRIIEEGSVYDIEAALDRDGEAQAVLYLEHLEAKKKTRALLDDVLMRFEDFAATGRLEVPRELNHLSDDLWEIKVQNVRFPFYYRTSEACGQVRLTHGFQKKTERTPLGQIDMGKAIIGEDRKQ